MLGWCASGKHDDCIESYVPFYFERNKIVYKDEVKECDCNCHQTPTPSK